MSSVQTKEYAESKSADPLAHWPQSLQDELEKDRYNPCVGTVLVSETDVVRVWHLYIPVGGRCNFHRHVLDYFWTAHAAGRARGYFSDGRIVDVDHFKGETKHFKYGPGEFKLHSVENIGTTDLVFTTVEFLHSSNPPLTVPDYARQTPPKA